MRQISPPTGETMVLVAEFAKRFRDNWGASVGGIARAGQVLVAAKAALTQGHFRDLVADLKLDERKAQYFMNVARHPIISNPHHWCAFPPSWGTLAELATIRTVPMRALIESGEINPTMTREEAVRLAPGRSQNPTPIPIGTVVG
jgi:hypothetical protein